MFERWKLGDFAPGQGIASGAQTPGHDDHGWLDVAVPGDVHRTLITAGRIADPFYDRHELECTWVETREWWYRLHLPGSGHQLADDERLRLIFHGLDTFATVWLNGVELGRHSNMFRPAEFDVTHSWHITDNTLAVCFVPPLQQIGEPPSTGWRSEPRSMMRKAQYGYGWDWGPRLPTIGIWRPVELRRERAAAVRSVHIATVDLAPRQERAALRVRLKVDAFATDRALTARLALTDPEGNLVLEQTLALDRPEDTTTYLTLDRPRLWWTHDIGEQALYRLDVKLLHDGAEVDRAATHFGVRTLALDQSPDPAERGTRFFRFVLNGVPIFARGANWIPCDSFVGAIPPERYARLLEAARDANMTMLRVWGGGIYEHDVFYEHCDRLGILVWQDFMFACASYPEDDPAFVAEVEAEARYQVRRLRNHASLALWCGNNENQWLIDRALWNRAELPAYGELYYNHVLPEAVAELDARTPYWPGSPFGGNDHNGPQDGDVHNWEAWHGNVPRRFGEQPRRDPTPENVSYRRYAEDLGRFVSEFGLHASPHRETLRRAIPADQMWHHSPALDWHNKDNPKNKGDNLMQTVTGLPADLDEYVDFSQIAQAEGLAFGIEHFRRRKPHCSGTLVWQLNDCWPVLSWSVLDYYGFPKASYYYVRRAYAPVLASFKECADGSVELWLTNDTLAAIEDVATVRLARFNGDLVHESHCRVDVPPNSSRSIQRWPAADLAPSPDRYLVVRSENAQFAPNRHFFSAIKDLQRPPARVEVAFEAGGPRDQRATLSAAPGAYALFVHLLASDERVRFSDNYFDLEAGEQRTIIVHHSTASSDVNALTLRWR